ncbi:MAG: hypothetical protein WBE42_10395, partial [Pseudolabrys sp.]
RQGPIVNHFLPATRSQSVRLWFLRGHIRRREFVTLLSGAAKNGKLVGILSEGDFLRRRARTEGHRAGSSS